MNKEWSLKHFNHNEWTKSKKRETQKEKCTEDRGW